MSKRILVPLDGSARAESALPVAARIARASGSALLLVQVVSIPVMYETPTTYGGEFIEQAINDAEDYLKTVAKEKTLEGIQVSTSALFGAAAQTILSVAGSYNCDLIVMTSRGQTGIWRWMLGSVAQKVTRHSPIAVLVLHETGTILPGIRPDGGPVRALVTLDGSVLAKAALEPAVRLVAALASPGHGALHLLRVIKPLAIDEQKLSAEQVEGLKRDAMRRSRSYMNSIARNLQENLQGLPPLSITWSVVFGDDAAEAIIQTAESGEDAAGAGMPGRCDLIAMATHGRTGFQHWVLGSVTERVLGETRMPILIVRPAETDFQQASDGSAFAEVEKV